MALFVTRQQWREVKSRGFTAYLRLKIKYFLSIGLFLVLAKIVFPIFNLRPRMTLPDFVFYVIGCFIASILLAVVTAMVGWAVNDSRVD